jgi:glycosyltransferase involved in cell wall biosynthesis
MLVSAIMPTRSRPALSRAALDCFLAQTHEPRELVILDDDDNPSFPDPPVDHRVGYLRRPRLTIGAKRNALCEAAQGDVIIHWDSDDWSAPERIGDQVERLLASDKPVTGYHSLLFWDERNGLGYRWTGPAGYACGASMCYWREFWAAHKFPNITVAEDNAMVLEAQKAGGIVSAEGRQMLVARVHGANTSSAQRIGQNNWPLIAKTEFPESFFLAIQ